MRLTIVAIALLALAACAPEPTLADYHRQCEGYGFQPGTDGMAGCVQNEVAQRRAAWMALALFPPVYQPPPPVVFSPSPRPLRY